MRPRHCASWRETSRSSAYAFDEQVHPVQVAAGKIALPEKPAGQETAIGAAIADVQRLEAGKRLLGMILLSDGAQRALAPRDLPAQLAVAQWKHQGDPLFTVVFGQSRGLGEAQDVAVKELLVNSTVFVKNELAITGQVRVDGYVNRDIPVRLLFEDALGKMEVVDQQTVRATTDGQLIPVHFTYNPPLPGEYKLTLEAVPQAAELVTTNNQLSTFVNVLKGGLRVLDIEGDLSGETKFLRYALGASPDINVDTLLRIDPRQPETKPADLAERFQPGKYEVVILHDVDSAAFRPSELKELAEAVGKGTGLIMLGGRQSFGAGGYSETALAEVLPVVMDRLDRQRLDEPATRSDLHWQGPLKMQPTALGLKHFALILAGSHDEQENLALWEKLPPLEWANKFSGLAPGAVVLADAGSDKPMLVAQPSAPAACWPSPAMPTEAGGCTDSSRSTSVSGGNWSFGRRARTRAWKAMCG